MAMSEGGSMGVWLASSIAVLFVGGLLTVLAVLLERSSPIRLRHWAEEAGGKLEALYKEPLRFEVFGFLLSGLARLAPIALLLCVWRSLSAAGNATPALIAALVTSVLVGGLEVVSRFLSARDPEAALRMLTVPYRVLLLLLAPLIAVLGPLVPPRFVQRREEDGEPEASEGEIEAFLTVGTEEGILEPGEQEMIKGIVDLGETLVRSVMTPRPDVVAARIDIDIDELAELFLSSNHSRIPLYRESIDHVAAVLHIRDLLRGLRASTPVSVEDIANAPFLVPETRPCDELLEQFQRLHQQMAIVVDEFGGTAGLVTVEDLVEEIVGEIADEHEQRVPDREQLPGGSWRISGRAHRETLTEIFGVLLDDVAEDTVGGMVFSLLGYVPQAGAATESRGLRFTVGEVEDRRIQSVVVSLVEEPSPETAPAEAEELGPR